MCVLPHPGPDDAADGVVLVAVDGQYTYYVQSRTPTERGGEREKEKRRSDEAQISLFTHPVLMLLLLSPSPTFFRSLPSAHSSSSPKMPNGNPISAACG